jgi:phage tail-like protein
MSLATAAGALALSGSGGAGAQPVTPAYGVAFRFAVSIGDLKLGDWQSCSGLKVDFKPAEMKAGGNYLGSHWLAGEASYSRVVLKRAAMQVSAGQLQTWLGSYATKGLTGDDRPETGKQCTITVFDSSGEPVMKCVLDNVRPAAWSGPDLDAGASKVAVETLELVHSGFSIEAGGSAAQDAAPASPPKTTGNAQAPACSLTEAGGAGGAASGKSVQFTFPPTEIGVQKRQLSTQNNGASGRSVNGRQVQVEERVADATASTPNITTYVLNNLILWGTDTRSHVETLDLWATKTPVTQQRRSATQPELSFTWGSGFSSIPVVLKSLSATYTRFTVDGHPIRAKVNLQLEKIVPAAEANGKPTTVAHGAQNPSSGGIPGRASHLFRDTENLPTLAQETYGDPTAWRALAEANRIDDPLRLVPGTSLLLPAPSEIASSEKRTGPR